MHNSPPPNINPSLFPSQSNNDENARVLPPFPIPPSGDLPPLPQLNLPGINQGYGSNGGNNPGPTQPILQMPEVNSPTATGSGWRNPRSPSSSQAGPTYPGNDQLPPSTPTNGPQTGPQTRFDVPQPQVPPPPTPNAAVQFQVNHLLQNPILQGLNIPPYPNPPNPTLRNVQVQIRAPSDLHYQSLIRTISTNIHNWTEIFEGDPIKTLSEQEINYVKGCLDHFEWIEPGLPATVNMGQLSIEGLYSTSTHRRLLAAHIIALAVQVHIFMPFFAGLDPSVGAVLVEITNSLFTEGTP